MSESLLELMDLLPRWLDSGKIYRAKLMLKKGKHLIHIHRSDEGISGIVKSQTNKKLEYSAILNMDGSHVCGTQNLNRCMGLRGGICKHCIMLTMAAVKGGIITPEEGSQWLRNSIGRTSRYNKKMGQEVFARFSNSNSGEIEFRVVEITEEDLMAF